MTVAYFDCFAGAAGDMIVGALIDAGADFAALSAHLEKLHVEGLVTRIEKVSRGGLPGTKFHVDVPEHSHDHDEHGHHDHHHHHCGLSEILALIAAAGLPPRAAARATAVFERLAKAEAKVHQTSVEEVHFHEVGAIDSIADIVGGCVALELLGIDEIRCSAIPLGSGTVKCAHGVLPVPPPATAELMRGALVAPSSIAEEMTTPTAAAILTALTAGYGAMPELAVSAVGYGAGTRDGGPMPNLLRVFIGEASPAGTADAVVELSANIDDSTGEVLGATIEKLLAAGCVDAWASPIVMKKSRPAWMLSALCFERDVPAVERIIFSETTTFGIRRRPCSRTKLDRRFEHVETPFGPIRIKIGSAAGQVLTASPEFADCAAAASAHHVSIREVMATAVTLYRQGHTT